MSFSERYRGTQYRPNPDVDDSCHPSRARSPAADGVGSSSSSCSWPPSPPRWLQAGSCSSPPTPSSGRLPAHRIGAAASGTPSPRQRRSRPVHGAIPDDIEIAACLLLSEDAQRQPDIDAYARTHWPVARRTWPPEHWQWRRRSKVRGRACRHSARPRRPRPSRLPGWPSSTSSPTPWARWLQHRETLRHAKPRSSDWTRRRRLARRWMRCRRPSSRRIQRRRARSRRSQARRGCGRQRSGGCVGNDLVGPMLSSRPVSLPPTTSAPADPQPAAAEASADAGDAEPACPIVARPVAFEAIRAGGLGAAPGGDIGRDRVQPLVRPSSLVGCLWVDRASAVSRLRRRQFTSRGRARSRRRAGHRAPDASPRGRARGRRDGDPHAPRPPDGPGPCTRRRRRSSSAPAITRTSPPSWPSPPTSRRSPSGRRCPLVGAGPRPRRDRLGCRRSPPTASR